MVVNNVKLFAEMVEGETHNIQEVSMDILYKHPTKSLDTVAACLVPKKQDKNISLQQFHQKRRDQMQTKCAVSE